MEILIKILLLIFVFFIGRKVIMDIIKEWRDEAILEAWVKSKISIYPHNKWWKIRYKHLTKK